MSHSIVMEAFLNRTAAMMGALRSDGSRLYCSESMVAEWKNGVLIIPQEPIDQAAEGHKDELVDHILRKIQREELLWQLVKPTSTRTQEQALTV